MMSNCTKKYESKPRKKNLKRWEHWTSKNENICEGPDSYQERPSSAYVKNNTFIKNNKRSSFGRTES